MEKEFYIGYLPEAPAAHKKWVKKFLGILIIAILLLAGLLTFGQGMISKGIFNFGKTSELEGYLRMYPVPHLKVYNDKGIYGENLYKTVILTGAFKFGAEEIVKEIFEKNNKDLNDTGFYCQLNGTLIYNDGKALFELTDGADAYLKTLDIPDNILNDTLSNQAMIDGFNPYRLETTLKGEIIDPKCYFGAMKPGSGKVHKSCAIRCISGGIPPVLKVSSESTNQYYILFGEDKKSVSSDILDYIAEPVEITGRFEALDDWFVLYIDPEKAIRKL